MQETPRKANPIGARSGDRAPTAVRTAAPWAKPGDAVGRCLAPAATAASGSGPSAVGKLASWGFAAVNLTAARACAGSQLAKRGQPPWQVAARDCPARRARELPSI